MPNSTRVIAEVGNAASDDIAAIYDPAGSIYRRIGASF
ncbi:unknow [Vibrio campbellii]|nr:unknow [Vibrio campbellii]